MFDFKINMYAIYEDLDIKAEFNLGNNEMVKGFFNSIAYHLENKKWGSIYPTIMNEFYSGKLEQKHINKAIQEIKDIKQKLSKIDYTQMVFDMNSVPEEKFISENISISLDDIFINNKREKMSDIILIVLKSIKKKKNPLYIGRYYYKELFDKKVIDTIENEKKKQKRNMIIKYTIYLIIVLIIKTIATEQQFNEFIIKFIFSMIIAEIVIFNSKKNIENKINEFDKKNEIKFNNDEPKIAIENITLERNLTSSTFDSILDEINCPMTVDGIIKTLKAKKIKKWQADIETIYNDLGHSKEYANKIIEDLEYNSQQFDKFEYYEIEDIYEVIPKEKIEWIYSESNIYRILLYDNYINLIIFYNQKVK